MKLNSDEVKRCPRCSESPEIEEWNPDSEDFKFIIQCPNRIAKKKIPCVGLTAFGSTITGVIEAWNENVKEFSYDEK